MEELWFLVVLDSDSYYPAFSLGLRALVMTPVAKLQVTLLAANLACREDIRNINERPYSLISPPPLTLYTSH